MVSPLFLERLLARLADGEPIGAAVVGAGESGRAAARLLLGRGATVAVLDDRADALSKLPDGLKRAPFTRKEVDAADLVVLSPGVPRARPELESALREGRLVGEVELASWFVRAPLIGITGTNGKSTTTALVGHILEKAGFRTFVGGNFGRPLADLVVSSEEVDIAVVELSSFQLESIERARFRVGVWLNLQPDHLDRYPSLDAYRGAKARLFERVEPEGIIVASSTDPVVRREAEAARASVRWFSVGAFSCEKAQGTSVQAGVALRQDERYVLDGPGLLGDHNHENAAAAIEVARFVGASKDAVQEGLSSFRGLAHRLQLVHEADGVLWYNDSKATNVASAVTALRAMSRPVILIVGGRDKGSSWAPLVDLAEGRVEHVLAIGEAAPLISAAFKGSALSVEAAGTLSLAVERARGLARAGQAVLLAPGCASFDQFKSFVDRGDTFAFLARQKGDGR